MGAGGDGVGEFLKMQGHGGGVAGGQYETGGLTLGRTDGAEQVGRFGPLIVGGRRPGAAPGPATGDLVLLADAGFVLPPELYGFSRRPLRRDLRQLGWEVFLNAAGASASWA